MRTDLAREAKTKTLSISGVIEESKSFGPFERVRITVETEEAAARLDKPMGVYTSIIMQKTMLMDAKMRDRCARLAAKELRLMLPHTGDILVIGLGNRYITADALGTKAAEAVIVTRHLKTMFSDLLPENTRTVSSFCTGVLGTTGMETIEVVSGICKRIRPSAVVVIDSLAAGDPDHLGTVIQMNDSGITPGAGIGNVQTSLNRKTLGVPVAAIGIPLVVSARALIGRLVKTPLSSEMDARIRDLSLTPKDIDLMVDHAAKLIALSINVALHEKNYPILKKILQ